MLLFLAAGFLMGMRHALEADHLTAVVALSTRAHGRMSTLIRGAAWGLGHSTSLLIIGGACLALGTTLSADAALWLERAVGLMLVALGVQVIVRLRRRRIHVHAHRHADGRRHIHAHRHESTDRAAERHEHPHPSGSHVRAGLVGLVHGMAGSAALVVLVSTSVESFWLGLGFIGTFGAGSILGMSVLSLTIALPLEYSERRLARVYDWIEAPIAIVTIALGMWMLRFGA